MKDSFNKERRKALEQIEQALQADLDALARKVPAMGDVSQMSLPDELKLSESLGRRVAANFLVSDLKEGKSLKEAFARVSARYRPAHKKPVVPLPEDMARTAQDGRESAFEDMLKALEIAERDFDISYRRLTPMEIASYQKKHPIEPQYIEYAHKENQRHFMKETLGELKTLLQGLKAKPPSP